MGVDEWVGLTVPLFAWFVMFTTLAIVTWRENHRKQAGDDQPRRD